MTFYAVHDQDGQLISSGTVIADPLPAGLTALALTDIDAAALQAGGVWDAATLTVGAPAPPEPDPVAERIAELEATVTDLLALLEG